MDDVRVGRSLRLLRQRRGLTQAQLASRSSVSPQLVSLVERGHLDAAHAVVLDVLFPVRGREMRMWLGQPIGPVGGILVLGAGAFVRSTNPGGAPGDRRGSLRVRTARPGAN